MERHHSDGETFFNKFGQRERTGIGLRQRVPPPGIITSTSFDHQSFPQPQHDSFRNIAALTSDERLLLKGLRPAGHGAPPPSLHSPPLGLHGHHHSHHHYQLPYSNEQQQQQYGGTTLSSYATFSTSEVLRQHSPPKSHRQSAVHFTSGEEGGDDLFQEIDRLRSSAYDMTRTNIYGTPHGDSLARQEELRRRPSWDMQPLDEVHHQPASQKGKMTGSTPLVQLMPAPSSKVVSPPPTMGGAVVSSSHPHPNPHTASPQQGTGYGTSWTSFNGPSGGVSSSSSLPHSSLSRHPLHEASPQLNKQQHRPPKQLDPLSSPPSVTTAGGGAGGPCSSSGPSSVLLSPPRYSGIGGGHHHQHHPLLTTGGGEENIAALLQQTSTNNDASPTRHRSLSPVEKQMRHVANLPGGMYCQPVPSCIEPLLQQQQQQQQRTAKVTGMNVKSTERRGRR